MATTQSSHLATARVWDDEETAALPKTAEPSRNVDRAPPRWKGTGMLLGLIVGCFLHLSSLGFSTLVVAYRRQGGTGARMGWCWAVASCAMSVAVIAGVTRALPRSKNGVVMRWSLQQGFFSGAVVGLTLCSLATNWVMMGKILPTHDLIIVLLSTLVPPIILEILGRLYMVEDDDISDEETSSSSLSKPLLPTIQESFEEDEETVAAVAASRHRCLISVGIILGCFVQLSCVAFEYVVHNNYRSAPVGTYTAAYALFAWPLFCMALAVLFVFRLRKALSPHDDVELASCMGICIGLNGCWLLTAMLLDLPLSIISTALLLFSSYCASQL